MYYFCLLFFGLVSCLAGPILGLRLKIVTFVFFFCLVACVLGPGLSFAFAFLLVLSLVLLGPFWA